MDLLLLSGVAVALLIVLITLYFLSKQKDTGEKDTQPAPGDNVPRRAQIVRNQRNRARVPAARVENAEDLDGDDDEVPHAAQDISGEKMGAKKRAKLEAKAEKKAQREAELKLREEQKMLDALAEEEKKQQEEKEAEEERKREEAEKKAQEEKARKEHEEYLKMKEAFNVEEEGYDQEEEDEKQNMLQDFITYVKETKVVVLEDLAAHFKLKTQAAISRITELQKDGRLSGVIDDRGKFIYISKEELSAVAKFIRQRGRVSITELAENSSSLIHLTSLTPISAP